MKFKYKYTQTASKIKNLIDFDHNNPFGFSSKNISLNAIANLNIHPINDYFDDLNHTYSGAYVFTIHVFDRTTHVFIIPFDKLHTFEEFDYERIFTVADNLIEKCENEFKKIK